MSLLPPDRWRNLLRRGWKGDDVLAWKQALLLAGYPITVNSEFDATTEKRTMQFQMDRGLDPDGVVGPMTRAAIGTPARPHTVDVVSPGIVTTHSVPEPWPFLSAKNFSWANRKAIRLVVIHTMETGETLDTAEAVAAWFAGKRGEAPKASAHVCVDGDSLVRCVHPQHVAWAAPGANRDGYQVELAGRARQSADDWDDHFSSSMLSIAAGHLVTICRDYGIPRRKLTVCEVLDGKTKGFCGHHDVTLAFKKSTHTDPGKHFPWQRFLGRVDTILSP